MEWIVKKGASAPFIKFPLSIYGELIAIASSISTEFGALLYAIQEKGGLKIVDFVIPEQEATET